MNTLVPKADWTMPAAPDGFVAVAEIGDDGIGLSWSRCPDETDGMEGDNWTDSPSIPWPFEDGPEHEGEVYSYAEASRALVALGFVLSEY